MSIEEKLKIKKPEEILEAIRDSMEKDIAVSRELALEIFRDDISVKELIDVASIPRHNHYGRGVRIHVLNNVQNGSCSEDCGYCAQRNDSGEERIASYSMKSREEILGEADDAARMGAFRYCLVLSGHGPSYRDIDLFTDIVKELKTRHPGMEICLSAGVLTDPAEAAKLKEAGLDRYNHNLNTSIAHYDQICTTHEFNERMGTIENLHQVGVELCSGVIVGLGESEDDLVDVADSLRRNHVASIPVNFFLPIPGHAIENPREITGDFALRVLALFRILNPRAEIRAAAGREVYLKNLHRLALKVANSLFVSGYLNVKGSNVMNTLQDIYDAGYEVDVTHSELPGELLDAMSLYRGQSRDSVSSGSAKLDLKDINDLRPHQN